MWIDSTIKDNVPRGLYLTPENMPHQTAKQKHMNYIVAVVYYLLS